MIPILRSLSRFDAATVEDITESVSAQKVTVWGHLKRAVKLGLAEKEGSQRARYRITEAGRVAVRERRVA